MQSTVIGQNQAGQRFDKFLQKFLPNAQTSFLYKMLRKKNITLNGKKAEGKELLNVGDEVKFFFSDETFEKFTGKHSSDSYPDTSQYQEAYKRLRGIAVIYEDEHVLIVNKPAGILTQKAAPSDLSLNEWMIGYLLSKKSISADELSTFKPSVVNRLDRNTSGLVLCGKSLAGSQTLSAMIHDRTIRKFYRTITSGSIQKKAQIDGYLVKDEASNQVTVFRSDASQTGSGSKMADHADQISTAYAPLQHFKVTDRRLPERSFTYLEVELITGKTHQIRAHLSSEGYPLIGDYKYGKRAVNDAFKRCFGLQAQFLHAYRLEFPELSGPLAALSGRSIEAPLPALFENILHNLEEM